MSGSIYSYYEEIEILNENIFEDIKNYISSNKFISNLDLAVSKKKKSYENSLKQLKSKLIRSGINTLKIEQIIKKNITQAISKIKQTDNIKEASSIISKSLVSTTKQIKTTLGQDIVKSLLLLFIVFIFSTFFSILFNLFFGVELGLILSIILVAPFVEEYSKLISIKQNITKTYFVVFNIVEFTGYILRFIGLTPLVPLVIARILAVLMHALTTYIQYKFQKDNNDPKTGYGIGVIIHMFWNIGIGTLLFNIINSLIEN